MDDLGGLWDRNKRNKKLLLVTGAFILLSLFFVLGISLLDLALGGFYGSKEILALVACILV